MLDLNKIYCMDCLEGMKRLDDKSIDMILCDLPYGVTQCKWDSIISLDELWKQYKRIMKDNSAIVLTSIQPFTSQLIISNKKMFKYCLVWVKNLKTGNLNARRRPMGGHEDIVVFYKKQPTYNPQKRKRTIEIKSGNIKNSKTSVYGKQRENYIDRQSDLINPDTVIKNINCVHNSSGKLHPTQKPLELFEYLIRTYTNENDLILDNCMGSGTTAVACKQLKRNYVGFEIDKEYCNLANGRLSADIDKKLIKDDELEDDPPEKDHGTQLDDFI